MLLYLIALTLLIVMLSMILFTLCRCDILYANILYIELGTSISVTRHKGKIMEKEYIKKYVKDRLVDSCILYVKLLDTDKTHKVEIDAKKYTKYNVDNVINCSLYWSNEGNVLLGSNIESETVSTSKVNTLYD